MGPGRKQAPEPRRRDYPVRSCHLESVILRPSGTILR